MTSTQAWQTLAATRLDLSEPVNRLASADFKALGMEPRLMTKFDSRASRPEVLASNGLFLLPETNGSYLVLRAEGYCDLAWPHSSQVEEVEAHFPLAFDSLRGARSEMSHLDRLFLAGVIQQVIGTRDVWATIRGRRFAPPFDFRVGDLGRFCANGIQYEVDQGYESEHEIVLFEAKNTTPADFLVRQLFFPFKVFSALSQKRIRLFFFNFNATTGVYSFFEYRFEDPAQYTSIQALACLHLRVRFGETEAPSTLGDWLHRTTQRSEATWEIPQADDFSKVMEFALRVESGCTDTGLIAGAFDFSARQSSYYRRASEQIGLIDGYALTDAGRDFVALPAQKREERMIRALLELPVAREAVRTALARPDRRICLSDIEASIARNSVLNGSTIGRRAQTVRSWLRWLQTTLGELRVGNVVLSLD